MGGVEPPTPLWLRQWSLYFSCPSLSSLHSRSAFPFLTAKRPPKFKCGSGRGLWAPSVGFWEIPGRKSILGIFWAQKSCLVATILVLFLCWATNTNFSPTSWKLVDWNCRTGKWRSKCKGWTLEDWTMTDDMARLTLQDWTMTDQWCIEAYVNKVQTCIYNVIFSWSVRMARRL